jgi:hypothetical protein
VVTRLRNPRSKHAWHSSDRQKVIPAANREFSIGEVIAILRIPVERRDRAVAELWGDIKHLGQLPFGDVEDNIEKIQRVGVLCDKILGELRGLNEAGFDFLAEGLNDNMLPNAMKILEHVAHNAKLIKRERRAPNRPSGSYAQPQLVELVGTLYEIAEDHGGKLTLSKDKSGAPIGNLRDAIIAVAPYYRLRGIKIPSYQTLRRMRNNAKEYYRRKKNWIRSRSGINNSR